MKIAQETLKTYRALLRHCGRLPSAKAPNSVYKEYIRSQFRESISEENKDTIRKMRLASSYVQLVHLLLPLSCARLIFVCAEGQVGAVQEAAHLRSLDTGDKLTPQYVSSCYQMYMG